MAEAPSSPPLSPSQPASVSAASPTLSDATGRPSSPNSGLAFLVHSPSTVSNNLPPEVDNKRLARQKRRRTSKEDEEILKAEYQKNPKPDKAARIDIVSRVALGEKEVQIWFQNRRQNDRRRSRPLDTSSALLLSSSSIMSDPATDDDTNAPAPEPETENTDVTKAHDSHFEDTEPVSSSDDAVEVHSPARATTPPVKDEATESQSSEDSVIVPSTDPQTVETAPTESASSQQSASASQDALQPRRAWLADRRSASFVRYNEENSAEFASASTTALPSTEWASSARELRRAHSFVRLKMTADGKARVVTDADQSPSPPHKPSSSSTFSTTSTAGLRRSYSAAGLNERLAAAASERSPKTPRTSSTVGRSRDSRAWEFWCDPDTRNNRSLTSQAEQEGSGSAVDAIGLLRANRRILAQNQSRQNALNLSRQNSSKVVGEQGVKKARQPLQRSSTSQGRLQTKANDSRKDSGSESDELPQTESDKENWEPEIPSQSQSRHARPYLSQPTPKRVRHVLGENTDVMSQSSSLGAMLAKEREKKGGVDPEQDEELRAFMGSAGARSSLSSAEEAGCVEGLLKLSQGNWR